MIVNESGLRKRNLPMQSTHVKLVKANSDISFKEFSKKICQSTNMKSDYGFYYDIEANRWLKPCALCDCGLCIKKDLEMRTKEIEREKKIKETEIENKKNERNGRIFMNVVSAVFVCGSFCAAALVLFKFA